MKCDVCEKEGKISQYPGPIPMSMCFCDECYNLEKIAYNKWRAKNNFKKCGEFPFFPVLF